MNDGTAWDVYDLLDSTTKANIKRALGPLGDDEEKMIRGLDNALRTYRADLGTAFVASVTMTSPDRARVIIAYSHGRSEYVTAVFENDSWRPDADLIRPGMAGGASGSDTPSAVDSPETLRGPSLGGAPRPALD